MGISRGFLRPENVINKSYIPMGIFVGLSTSFWLYLLFYFSREIFRAFSAFFTSGILVQLTATEHFYYNLFYASMAAVFGFYVTLKFVVENSINYENKSFKHKQRRILNEQGFLKWIFFSAFTRLASVIGIWYNSFPLQFEVDIFKEFWLLLLLLPLAFFMNIWPVILKVAGKKAYKWMAISFICIAVLSFGFANIHLSNFKKFDNKLLNLNVEHAYNIRIPESRNPQKLDRISLVTDIYIYVDSLDEYKPKIIWRYKENEVGLNEIAKYVYEEKAGLADMDKESLIANLHIDERVPLSFVNSLKQELRKAYLRKIQYSTGVQNSKHPSNYALFKYYGIPQTLPVYNKGMKIFLDSIEKIDLSNKRIKIPDSPIFRTQDIKKYNRIEIYVDNDNLLLNGNPVSTDQLHDFLYRFVKKYAPDYRIIFSNDEGITYGTYLGCLDQIHTAIGRLRNEMSYQLHNEPFPERHAPWDKKTNLILDKYPIHIVEWAPEEKRLMKVVEEINKKRK